MMHKDLNPEEWQKQPLVTQLANIGSEVIRALNWKDKNNLAYASAANLRALELFDITLMGLDEQSQLKEIARARELWLDFFLGENQYNETPQQWKKYFLAFNHAAQINM